MWGCGRTHYVPTTRDLSGNWTRHYDNRISKLLAQHRYQEALRAFDGLAQKIEVYGYVSELDIAEPLYKRTLTIMERDLGPEHPYVAQSLENYAALLRSHYGREGEAAKLEARAKTIRAKYE
jgi:hypothetical protein